MPESYNEATRTRPEQSGRELLSSEYRPQPDLPRGRRHAGGLGWRRADVLRRAAAPLRNLARWSYGNGGKRTWDLAGAAASLLLAALPLAVCMVLIRRESPGPALLAQWRLGRDGRPFRLWKLRTMRVEAEADGRARFARPGDARLTRIGAWLRAWHADELPQLWNVLRGDMSLVGPRPERPAFARRFARDIPGYRRRLEVRPGLTGWAQVNAGYAAGAAGARCKLRYDLDYLARAGWRLDWRVWQLTWDVAGRSLARHRRHCRLRAAPLSPGCEHAVAASAGRPPLSARPAMGPTPRRLRLGSPVGQAAAGIRLAAMRARSARGASKLTGAGPCPAAPGIPLGLAPARGPASPKGRER
ncbi:MAG: sugar transferase, partial [Terriglobales bacterium]